MSEVDPEPFAVRYRLEQHDARLAVHSSLVENAPYLVGLALLEVLCAVTTVFGTAGTVALIAIPGLVLWWFLAGYRRAEAAIRTQAGAELGARFSAAGLAIESATSKIELAWAGVRRIDRRRDGWIFTTRAGSRFYVPSRAIPAEARAPIVRWATAGKARIG